MTDVRVTGDVHAFSPTVAAAFTDTLRRSLEDLRFGFKYPLLRLELAGLTMEEVEQLRELARRVFRREDVGEAASAVRDRPAASPLARALVDIATAAPSLVDRRMVLLGAILGAHAAHHTLEKTGTGGALSAVIGAITGAVAVSMTAFVEHDLDDRAWTHFIDREPGGSSGAE
jgi:hypothetical protein